MAASKSLGYSVKTTSHKVRKDAFWFGESQSRVVVSVSKEKKEDFETLLKTQNVDFSELGSVVSEKVCQIDGNIWLSVDDAKEVFEATLPKYLN
jgi:phosphoribosylformylglycinamidine synthase